MQKLSPDAVKESELAGEPITAKLTKAPGNQAPIGGLKVVAKNGWFAARPSGTENIYKIYAESFKSESHLHAILSEAEKIVGNALRFWSCGVSTSGGPVTFRHFRRITAHPACCCTSRLFPQLTASGTWGRRPFPGSIFCITPASAGGSPFRSDQPVMGIRPISRCRHLRETFC